jgi:hypothetical protein
VPNDDDVIIKRYCLWLPISKILRDLTLCFTFLLQRQPITKRHVMLINADNVHRVTCYADKLRKKTRPTVAKLSSDEDFKVVIRLVHVFCPRFVPTPQFPVFSNSHTRSNSAVRSTEDSAEAKFIVISR